MKATKALAKILKRENIEFVTTFPYNPALDCIAEEGIRIIKTRNERAAVNIADGYSRASFGKRIGVCATQYGPGAENAFSGIAHAFADSVPILILSEGYFQNRRQEPTFDIVYNYKNITKWVEEFRIVNAIPQKMRRAFNFLRNGRPAPVMLVLPRDVAENELEDDFIYKSPPHSKPAPDSSDIKKALDILLEANLPVIRAGSGIHYAQAWEELKHFSEMLQIPVFTTQNSKSSFPESHSLSLGCGGATRPDTVVKFLKKADLVFSIGSSLTKEPFTTNLPSDISIIQSTIDERDLAKNYNIDHAIIGDAKLVLKDLIKTGEERNLSRITNDNICKKISKTKNQWLKKWEAKLNSDEIPINPYRVITEIRSVFDEKKTIITHDAGCPRDQLIPFYQSNTPGGYLGWGKSSTLGQGLGLAMGAKLASPEKTVIAVMGDGAFGMVGMDFETATREEIPIIVIVLNNSVLAGYRERLPESSRRFNIEKLSGNYCKVAKGLGAGYARKVTKPDNLSFVLKEARDSLSSQKPAFLEIISAEETKKSNQQLPW